MYDLESINAEQIVTATDRLLRGYPAKRLARGTADLSVAARRAVAASAVTEERTVYVREAPKAPTYLKLLGAAAAAAWVTVAVCLLV